MVTSRKLTALILIILIIETSFSAKRSRKRKPKKKPRPKPPKIEVETINWDRGYYYVPCTHIGQCGDSCVEGQIALAPYFGCGQRKCCVSISDCTEAGGRCAGRFWWNEGDCGKDAVFTSDFECGRRELTCCMDAGVAECKSVLGYCVDAGTCVGTTSSAACGTDKECCISQDNTACPKQGGSCLPPGQACDPEVGAVSEVGKCPDGGTCCVASRAAKRCRAAAGGKAACKDVCQVPDEVEIPVAPSVCTGQRSKCCVQLFDPKKCEDISGRCIAADAPCSGFEQNDMTFCGMGGKCCVTGQDATCGAQGGRCLASCTDDKGTISPIGTDCTAQQQCCVHKRANKRCEFASNAPKRTATCRPECEPGERVVKVGGAICPKDKQCCAPSSSSNGYSLSSPAANETTNAS